MFVMLTASVKWRLFDGIPFNKIQIFICIIDVWQGEGMGPCKKVYNDLWNWLGKRRSCKRNKDTFRESDSSFCNIEKHHS